MTCWTGMLSSFSHKSPTSLLWIPTLTLVWTTSFGTSRRNDELTSISWVDSDGQCADEEKMEWWLVCVIYKRIWNGHGVRVWEKCWFSIWWLFLGFVTRNIHKTFCKHRLLKCQDVYKLWTFQTSYERCHLQQDLTTHTKQVSEQEL